MGQYHIVVNLDRKQLIHPNHLGDGLKLMEFGDGGATLTALAILLAQDSGRGLGDLHVAMPDTPLPWEETGTAGFCSERKRKVVPRHSRDRIRKALEEAIQEQPPPSLFEVARRLGYMHTCALHHADHGHCVQIRKRYRQSNRWASWSQQGAKPICELPRLKQVLEDYLRAEDRIPSMERIAASLGYAGATHIRKKFPELWRAIGEKITRQRAERIETIKPALKQALQENPPPTLGELGRRAGVSHSGLLRALAPTLRQKIKERRRQYIEAKLAGLHCKLKASLNETPPPRRQEVYARLGIVADFARGHFPELHLALGARYSEYQRKQRRAQEKATRQAIPAIVQRLHEQGLCPSVDRVRDSLKSRCALQWKAFGETVYEARRSLRTG